MNLHQIISSIKKKIVSPKVYAIELDCGSMAFLNICVAYSLEEAMMMTRKAILRDPRKSGYDLAGWNLRKYAFKELESLFNESIDIELSNNTDTIVDKNELMKRIISTHDINLYHENISIFSEPEKKMLNKKLESDDTDIIS